MTDAGSATAVFEAGIEAVIDGDIAALEALLREHPQLVRQRSARVTKFDPPRHRATLLHYVAANGVEGYRQKSPPNAAAVARLLLEAGADPNALADMYGGQYATMSMLVSSVHPARAGVQVALVDVLADYGAMVEPLGSDTWGSPLLTALVFGYRDAAEALVRRGAGIRGIDAAAGLGRTDLVRDMLPSANAEQRHRAFVLAALLGHADIVRLFLDAGEDPNRYNPKGMHSHSTPLHQAALAGREDIVRLLVESGARLDLRDKVHHGTPLGWALHGGQAATADYLRDQERRRL
jgi:ankyrin repeat protein